MKDTRVSGRGVADGGISHHLSTLVDAGSGAVPAAREGAEIRHCRVGRGYQEGTAIVRGAVAGSARGVPCHLAGVIDAESLTEAPAQRAKVNPASIGRGYQEGVWI